MTAKIQEYAFQRLCDDVRTCTTCGRVRHCHVLGPANGPLDARVLFVAEAPGRRGGAVTGVPLTRDESGRRFERFLSLAGLCRDEVFVTNAVLCNPLDAAGRNRSPAAREVSHCRPFLERTLDVVRAPLVVALGRVALDALAAIEPHPLTLAAPESVHWRGRQLAALYHPSRQSTLHRAEAAQADDWQLLGQTVAGAAARPVIG